MVSNPTQAALSRAELKDILTFYQEAGIDCAIGDEPLNRFADETPDPAPAVQPPRAPLPRNLPPPPPPSSGEAAPSAEFATVAAREAAATAETLDALRALMEAFDGCTLKSTASRLVFADGNPQAKVILRRPICRNRRNANDSTSTKQLQIASSHG